MSNREKADEAKEALKEAENKGRLAKKKFEEIGDPEGYKKADAVVKTSRDAKEYVEKRLGKEGN